MAERAGAQLVGTQLSHNMRDRQPDERSSLAGFILKRMLQVSFSILIQAAILFVSSGRLDWVMAWVYVGVFVVVLAVNALTILPKDPELIAERAQTKENTKGWDKLVTNMIGISTLATLALAGLDLRFSWSQFSALWIQMTALVLVVFGYGLASWAMVSNKFFSRVVRIQIDRNQTVATDGPYGIMRHPSYLGMAVYSLATPLMLGSLWATVPAGITATLFVIRTYLEDTTLQKELTGYADYAKKVRYRLLPGIW